MDAYFTDRENGERPRTVDTIAEPLWKGLSGLIESRLEDDSFGWRFPLRCPDGHGVYGCRDEHFWGVLKSEVPDLEWPQLYDQMPDTPIIISNSQYDGGACGGAAH